MKGRALFILEKKPQLLVYIFAALTVSSALTAAQGQSTEQLYKQAIAADERGDIIRRNPGGSPTASPGIPEPLIDPSFDGKTLTFKVCHRHAHPGTEHDPPVSFHFELEGPDKLIGVNHEGPPVQLVRDMPY
jgi:hypothetical protein